MLLSDSTARYISESELSADLIQSCAYYPKVDWSLNCRLSSCTASYSSESELSAVGLNSRLSPTMPEGVIRPIVTLGTIRPEDSGAAQNATVFQH